MRTWLIFLVVILLLGCGKDNPTDLGDDSGSPPPETKFRITIENHSQRNYTGHRYGKSETIFNNQTYNTWPGDYLAIGSFPEDQYEFQVEIYIQDFQGRWFTHRIGQGTIYIDHNSTLKIYNDSIIWR